MSAECFLSLLFFCEVGKESWRKEREFALLRMKYVVVCPNRSDSLFLYLPHDLGCWLIEQYLYVYFCCAYMQKSVPCIMLDHVMYI